MIMKVSDGLVSSNTSVDLDYFCIISFAGIAIFCMLLTYYMWIKAVKTGTIYWATLAALSYFYMVGKI